jgi:hypothetical protein
MGSNTIVGRGLRAFDPTTPEGLANIGTGGMYGMNQTLAGGGSGKGGKGGQAPATPDFAAAAQNQAQQSQQNTQQQTQANRPTQQGPFGTSQWTQDPTTGQWTQNVSLTPGLNDAAQNIIGGLGTGQVNPAQARDQAIQAAYGQATSRLDPQWQQRQAALDTQLSNQGLTPGSRAYDAARQNANLAQNDAYAQAMYNAQTGAGNAAFGQSLAANMQPYQQLGALQGLAQPGNFMGAGRAETPNLLGALGQQYAGQLQNYGIDQAGKNSKLSGAASLGGAALAGSDERLKDKIERLPFEAIPGVPFATWEWKHRPGERQLGVIAQDLEKVRPDLVFLRDDGIRLVDYGKLWEIRHA